MWVFDGEEWFEEGAKEKKRTSNSTDPQLNEEFVPELQIVEVPSTSRDAYMPLIPIPMPVPVPVPKRRR